MTRVTKQRAAVLAWQWMIICDVLVFAVAVVVASLMLNSTCRLDTASKNSSSDVHQFVYKESGCSGAGETDATSEPYPWAMLLSTLCFPASRTSCVSDTAGTDFASSCTTAVTFMGED